MKKIRLLQIFIIFLSILFLNNVYWDESNNIKEVNSFKVLSSEMIWETEIKLTFSDEISSDWDRNFRIELSNNPWVFFYVVNSKILENPKNLILEIDSKLIAWNTYKVIVRSITNKIWKNIEYWVNAETEFVAKDFSDGKLNLPDIIKEPIDLNSAGPNWKDLEKKDIKKDVILTSKEKKKLPTAWPEHILLFILAILFSGIFFLYRFKKS